MQPMQTVTSQNFAAFLDRRELVLVAFVAEGAPAVEPFLPVLRSFAAAGPDVAVGVVDVKSSAELARDFRVQAVPTLAVFRARHLVFLEAGALSREALDALIDAARAADLSCVRSSS